MALQPRSVVWHALLFGVVAAFVIGTAYYALAHARSAAFADERAFRVLGDIAEQISNLQMSRAWALAFLPAEAEKGVQECGARTAGDDAGAADQLSRYLARLDLFGPSLCRHDKSRAAVCPASGDRGDTVFLLSRNGQDTMTVVHCDERLITLQEPLEKVTAHFIAQNLFDEALVVLANGEVLSEFTPRDATANGATVDFHPSMAERLNILDAGELLRQAREAQGRRSDTAQNEERKVPVSDSTVLGNPVAFLTQIGGRDYRAFVLPFRSPHPFVTESSLAAEKDVPRSSRLYIIGLQRPLVSKAIIHTLWPYGAWIITLALAFFVLAWPLASLAFEPVQEGISPRRAVVCVFATILLTALLTVAAGSLWSQRTLVSWMSQSAQQYALQLKSALEAEIDDAVALLVSNRNRYQYWDYWYGLSTPCADLQLARSSKTPPAELPAFPDRADPVAAAGSAGPVVQTMSAPAAPQICPNPDSNLDVFPIAYSSDAPRCAKLAAPIARLDSKDVCATLRLRSIDGSPTWSPFRNIIALDAAGNRVGPSLTVYGDVPVKRSVNLTNRPYFQALRFGEGWVSGSERTKGESFVAQRLFNRSDASRALQIAVPRCTSQEPGEPAEFCGILTGDIRMHSLIASVAPPLLKFAVIDQTSGTVLFHSDDRRSLAENFFREAENEPALRAAIRARQPSTFFGSYLGESHGFHYQPLRDIPWGVVVFFPMKELGDIPFHAGSAALSAYAGMFVVGVVLLMLSLAAWFAFKSRSGIFRALAERICPVFPLSARYLRLGRLHASLWAVVTLVLILMFDPDVFRFATLHIGWLRIPAFVLLPSLVLIAVLLIDAFRPYRPRYDLKDERSVRVAQLNAYTERAVLVLVVFAILPAIWLVTHFHDLQLKGLLRDSLVQASYQMQDRQRLIRHDLRRWVPPNGQERDTHTQLPIYPRAETIAERGIPGVQAATFTTFDSVPWSSTGAPEKLGMLAEPIWAATTGSTAQLRRLGLLSSLSRGEVRCSSQDGHEHCQLNADDGRPIALAASASVANFLRHPGGDTYSKTFNVLTVGAALLLSLFAGHLLAQFLARHLLGLSRSFAPISQKPYPPFDEKRFDLVWSELTPTERITLHQIAQGDLPNPRNEAVLKKLYDKGLLRFDHWLCLRQGLHQNDGLRRRILEEISPEDHARFRSEAPRNIWRSIRTPLFVLLMILIAWLSWAAGGSMQALSAVLVGTVAFLGQIMQLVNFARGASTPKS